MVDIKKIIKEEINDFDFLNINEIDTFENQKKILESRDFQIQFINDVLNDLNNKNKFKSINTTYKHLSNDQAGFISEEPLNIELDIDIVYNYNGNDVSLNIIFSGDNIKYDLNIDRKYSTYDNPEEVDMNLNSLDWSSIDVSLFTSDGDRIKFDWVKNAKFYDNFVKMFIYPIINDSL